jgi:hypothetical protein
MSDETEANSLAGGLIATALIDVLLVKGQINHLEVKSVLKRVYDSLDGQNNDPRAMNARRAITKLMNGRYADRD